MADLPANPAVAAQRTYRLALLLCLALLNPAAANGPVDFQLEDLGGQPVKLSDYRGKWVVVNFWASWCPPCIKELPELADYQARHGDTVQVLGINFEDTTAADTREFLENIAPTNFPHLKYREGDEGLPESFFLDRSGKPLSLQGLPSTFFVSPEGEMLGLHLGPLDAEQLHRKLDSYRR